MSSTFYDNFKKHQMRYKKFQIYKKIAQTGYLLLQAWVISHELEKQCKTQLTVLKYIFISQLQNTLLKILLLILKSPWVCHLFIHWKNTWSWECNNKKTYKNVCLHWVYTFVEGIRKQNKYVHDALWLEKNKF